MNYVNIKEDTEDRLHLAREPAFRSWALLLGLLGLGFGAAYCSGDYLWWKVAYISGAVFIGLTCMEDWEECILDRKSNKVTIQKQSLIQKFIRASDNNKIMIGDLNDVQSVSVQEEEVKYSGKGYVVVLKFASGFSLAVTETTVVGERSEQDMIAEKIQKFLRLESCPEYSEPEQIDEPAAEPFMPSSAEENNIQPSPETSTDESDDSFEQITSDELKMYNEKETVPSDIKESADEEAEKGTTSTDN